MPHVTTLGGVFGNQYSEGCPPEAVLALGLVSLLKVQLPPGQGTVPLR